MNQLIIKNPLNQDLKSKFFNFLINLSDKRRKVIDSLFKRSNFHSHIDPAQKTIAKESDCSRDWVITTTNEAQEIGILKKVYNHRYTSQYIFHPLLLDLDFRETLRPYFKNVRWLPLSLILLKSLQISEKYFNSDNRHHLKKGISLKRNREERERKEDIKLTYIRESTDSDTTNRKYGDRKMLQVENDGVEEIVISAYVANVAKKLSFSQDQEIKISKFPDEVVKVAMSSYEFLSKKKTVDAPFWYIFRACTKESERIANQPKYKITRLTDSGTGTGTGTVVTTTETTQKEYNKKEITNPPKPFYSKTYEQNLEMFNDWWLKHADECAKYYRKDKKRYADEFMAELDKRMDDPNFKAIQERAKKLEYILMKIKPESNTINEENKIDISIEGDRKD